MAPWVHITFLCLNWYFHTAAYWVLWIYTLISTTVSETLLYIVGRAVQPFLSYILKFLERTQNQIVKKKKK